MSATTVGPKPNAPASRNGRGRTSSEAQPDTAPPVDLAPGQLAHDAHPHCAGVDLLPAHSSNGNHAPLGGDALSHGHDECHKRSAEGALDGRHLRSDTQVTGASDAAPETQSSNVTQRSPGSGAAALLALAAATLDDLERTRIATQNRLRAMRDDQGLGDTPEYEAIAGLYDGLVLAEHQAELTLKRTLRKHPLHKWVKGMIGVGEKQAARLLAAVDDPTWNYRDDRPRRGPAEFWQYCGHGDPERSRRRKGQRVEFSPDAKMRTHLIAESCIKQARSPYRAVYDQARAAWADRETSDGHKHNHALRLVGKAFLRDLFLAAKETP